MSEETREIQRVRALLYGLSRSFFPPEGARDLLGLWCEVLSKLVATDLRPLSRAAEELAALLRALPPEAVEEEFRFLFLDPFAGANLPLEASSYLDGRPFGPSLARLRDLLRRAGLSRARGVGEPEDHLGLLLEFMEVMVSEGKGLPFQRELFYNYLRPCVRGVVQGLARQGGGPRIYPALLRFLEAFLDLEEQFLAGEDLPG